MIKVEKSVYYYPSSDANRIYTYGMCDFNFKDRRGTYHGKYEIYVEAITNNGLFTGSRIIFSLVINSKVQEYVDLFIKNFAISDYDVKKIFNLVSRQSNSRLHGLNIINYNIDYIESSLCVLYTFNTTKLELYGIPRYLFVRCFCQIDTINELPSKGYGGGFVFRVYGLSSLDLAHTAFCACASDNNAQYYDRINVNCTKETYTLIYMDEFFNAGCADENGNINESYFESLSGTEDLLDVLDGYCYPNYFIIPFDLESCFSNSKMLLNMTEKSVDTYIKKQGFGEYIKL